MKTKASVDLLALEILDLESCLARYKDAAAIARKLRAIVPRRWQAIADITTIVHGGGTAKTFVHEPFVPFIRAGDLNTFRPITDAPLYITRADARARVFPVHTVLVACTASIGSVGITGVEASCNQQINAVLPVSKLHPRFVLHWAHAQTPRLLTVANGSRIQSVPKDVFAASLFPVMPYVEQAAIAKQLDALARLIGRTPAYAQALTKVFGKY